MFSSDIEKIASELPADLVNTLRTAGVHKVAGALSGVPDVLNESALYQKIGSDLLGRLHERRQIVQGLVHLNGLGG